MAACARLPQPASATNRSVGRVGEELADVLIYLVRLADVLEIDLADAALRKLQGSTTRFPADEVRGQAPEKA